MKIRIDREGEFVARKFLPNSAQCGRKTEAPTYLYKVSIDADETALDERGFLIDNNAIALYFIEEYERHAGVTRIMRPAASCEVIALWACEAFRTKVPRASRIAVTIWGGETKHAGLTAEWDNKEQIEMQMEINHAFALDTLGQDVR